MKINDIILSQRTRQPLRLALGVLLAYSSTVYAQYIGFVYPAGGQRGTTFRVTIGGQGLAGLDRAIVSGSGVTAKIIEYNKKMNNQEVQLVSEQLRELKNDPPERPDPALSNRVARLERILRENVQTPACGSIANLAIVEVTIARDATPGQREIRLCTQRGISNPLVFNVGQVPEYSAEPMVTCPLVTLGKEEQSLRRKKREQKASSGEMMMEGMMMGSAGAQSDFDDEEVCVKIPCTINGQIAQGSVDRYRFDAKKGQKLVIIVQARDLVPYMADAVPGWFQPVLVLCDAKGKEVAYVDDYHFKPDPVMLYDVQEDGDYHLALYDSIFRGREDFVYRITIGEFPFITSVFPMGTRTGETVKVELKGWNLDDTSLTPDISNKPANSICPLVARGKGGLLVSPPMPFAVDALPECLEKEPNSQHRTAQTITLPVMINGKISNPGKKDIFRFEGREGDDIVAEVYARRLNSPLDSILKLTTADGKILASNDDREDAAAGINTHHADSYLRVKLPADDTYYVHIEDTQHKSGDDYVYRLRISPPQPDFAIRLVPSMVSMRSNSTASIKAFVLRQDGFTNAIRFAITGDTNFTATGLITGTQATTQVTIKTTLAETTIPAVITVEGISTNRTQRWVREAVPTEDRMQAFLWRHLVPAQELRALVYNPPPPPPPSPRR